MTSPLIAPPSLAGLLGEVTLLDVRYRLGGPPGAPEFEAGHIPGASYVDLDAALAAPAGEGGRHPLPEPAVFVAAMRAAGVSQGRPVVVYDDWQGRAAARCWWLLRDYGHPDVRVLDGGWTAWLAAGGAVETGPTSGPAGGFDAAPGHCAVVDTDTLATFAGPVIDARELERFTGASEPVDPVGGHIPGALNVPTSANLTASGIFRPGPELADLYPEESAVVYCGSGVTACHDLLAMAAGGREGILYPGSWSEWIRDPSRPVATGP